MKHTIIIAMSLLLLAGCARTSVMPLGNNLLQIDASAPPVLGRTGAQKAGIKKAAEATLEYDKHSFIVVDKGSWSDLNISGSSNGSFSASNGYAFGNHSSSFGTTRTSQTSIVIKMFNKGERGSKNAINAQSYLDTLKPKEKEVKAKLK